MKILDSARRWSVLAYYQIRGRQVRGGPWESFWDDVRSHQPEGPVLWDDQPAGAAAVDLERFRRAFDPRLPLLDIGCGNGQQTRFLAQTFRHVIGVDGLGRRGRPGSSAVPGVSQHQLPRARRHRARGRRLARPRDRDTNIYLRGVLHVLPARQRVLFVESLRVLLGRRGTLYLVEVNHHVLSRLSLFHDDLTPSGLPAAVEQVVKHGVRPRGFEPADRRSLFPESQWSVLGEGDATIHTVPLAGQEGANLPATWSLLRPKRETDH